MTPCPWLLRFSDADLLVTTLHIGFCLKALYVLFPLLQMLFLVHGSHLPLLQVFAQSHLLSDPALTTLFKLQPRPDPCGSAGHLPAKQVAS